MSSKICFGIFLISFYGAIIEGLVLEKNENSFIMLVITGIIMILAIIAVEALSRIRKRLRF
jgi:hypothetical protein